MSNALTPRERHRGNRIFDAAHHMSAKDSDSGFTKSCKGLVETTSSKAVASVLLSHFESSLVFLYAGHRLWGGRRTLCPPQCNENKSKREKFNITDQKKLTSHQEILEREYLCLVAQICLASPFPSSQGSFDVQRSSNRDYARQVLQLRSDTPDRVVPRLSLM
ncbi:uncharacterized protein RSE6_00534 [Rhynchosporium secalis]|uniref:Uncharacterized protein n=1 Tax=Rhynchosporium secalis TaxID=38038 RepID=A0A1E1LVG7_RHYSE|nr:uncharacterized protein RSE6_00534 [Rhynchosporium secalis]